MIKITFWKAGEADWGVHLGSINHTQPRTFITISGTYLSPLWMCRGG